MTTRKIYMGTQAKYILCIIYIIYNIYISIIYIYITTYIYVCVCVYICLVVEFIFFDIFKEKGIWSYYIYIHIYVIMKTMCPPYITPILILWDLSTLCVVDHLWLLIHITLKNFFYSNLKILHFLFPWQLPMITNLDRIFKTLVIKTYLKFLLLLSG